MTATAAPNAGAQFSGHAGGPFEIAWVRPQPASSQVGRGQFATIDPATGYAALNDGTVGYRLPGGIGNVQFLSPSSARDGDSLVDLWAGTVPGMAQSTISLDGFTDADICAPFYVADENTPGKLAVYGGNDRSFGGLVMGMEPGSTTIPRLVTGPIAGLLAMLAHFKDNHSAGLLTYAVDASASTDLGSSSAPIPIPRSKTRAQITSIEIIPVSALSATSGSDSTITVVKIDTTGAVALASSPVVATFTTTTALVAGQPTQFTLSATAANLKLRSTDVLGYYRTHASSGAVIPLSAIRANAKVL